MEKTVGKPIKRTEDPRLIQGLAHYVDDIRLPDTLHAAFLRSIHAHARIKSIDTTAAQKLPGVVAVYTGQDTQKIGPVPCAVTPSAGMRQSTSNCCACASPLVPTTAYSGNG